MKTKEITNRHYSAEAYYRTARGELEAWKKIEAERPLEEWEEIEKREALEDTEYYGILWAEEIERERQELCRSQGLSRWC